MYQKRSSAPEALLLRLILFRGRFFASLLGCLRVTLGAPTAGWWLREEEELPPDVGGGRGSRQGGGRWRETSSTPELA